MLPAGDGANGYKSLTMHGTGMDYPVYADLQEIRARCGQSVRRGRSGGTVLYSRGMYAAMVISEAIRKAQEMAGTVGR